MKALPVIVAVVGVVLLVRLGLRRRGRRRPSPVGKLAGRLGGSGLG